MKIMLTVLLIATAVFACANGHGMLWEPPNRSSIWRWYPDKGVVNYDDNQNFCGGRGVQYSENGGKCGTCGDNYKDTVPRANENGGIYGKGFVPRIYKSGTNIQVHVYITATHLGWFEFNICELSTANEVETEDCFNKHRLLLIDGTDKYTVTEEINFAPQMHTIYLQLPANLTCERCVMRWHYWTGNSYGDCPDGTNQLGCGDQEVFRSCSDITIV